MAFPKTLAELREQGYIFDGHRKCYGATCGKVIELWKTPKGKTMPFDVDEKGNVIAHWASCPDAESFR